MILLAAIAKAEEALEDFFKGHWYGNDFDLILVVALGIFAVYPEFNISNSAPY